MYKILKIWFLALRPRTLILAWLAVLIATSLAIHSNQFSLLIAFLTLITATLLQILTNLANDYGDAIKGVDNIQRLGPLRAMQTGLISAPQMKFAIYLVIGLTITSGSCLIYIANISLIKALVFLLLGGLAIVAALTYTLGKKPYGYRALGDLSVLIFFGWVAVAGSYYLQTQELAAWIFLPASAQGLLAVAVLNINNLRDIDNDLAQGKITLAGLLGLEKAKVYQVLVIILALVAFGLSFIFFQFSWIYFLFLLSAFIIIKPVKNVLQLKTPNQAISLLPQIILTVTGIVFLYVFAVLLASV